MTHHCWEMQQKAPHWPQRPCMNAWIWLLENFSTFWWKLYSFSRLCLWAQYVAITQQICNQVPDLPCLYYKSPFTLFAGAYHWLTLERDGIYRTTMAVFSASTSSTVTQASASTVTTTTFSLPQTLPNVSEEVCVTCLRNIQQYTCIIDFVSRSSFCWKIGFDIVIMRVHLLIPKHLANGIFRDSLYQVPITTYNPDSRVTVTAHHTVHTALALSPWLAIRTEETTVLMDVKSAEAATEEVLIIV